MNQTDLEKLLRKIGLSGFKQTNENLMHCCPNHQERRPSWGISTSEPHFHGCFVCGFKGTIVDLLIRVGGWSQAKALKTVGRHVRDEEYELPHFRFGKKGLDLKPINREEMFVFEEINRTMKARKYIALHRKISRRVIREAKLHWDKRLNRVIFPWYYQNKLVGITGRSILKDDPVKTLPYHNTQKGSVLYLPMGKIDPDKPLVLVEGEIDALKVASAKHDNVAAFGFGLVTDEQISLILNSGVEEVITFMDNDYEGANFEKRINRKLSGKVRLHKVQYDLINEGDLSLDPAKLTTKEIRMLLKTGLRKYSDWKLLSLRSR